MPEAAVSASTLRNDAARWKLFHDSYKATRDALDDAIEITRAAIDDETNPTVKQDLQTQLNDLRTKRAQLELRYSAAEQKQGSINPPTPQEVAQHVAEAQKVANQTADNQGARAAIKLATDAFATFSKFRSA